MVLLTPAEMPMSFAGQGLLWAAKSNILNPVNAGQGSFNRFVGKPIRGLVRLIYQLAMAIIAPFGFLYHMAMAAASKIHSCHSKEEAVKQKKGALACEHLIAGLNDLIVALSLGARTPFFVEPNASISHYLNSTLVQCHPLPITPEVVADQVLPTISSTHRIDLTNMLAGKFKFNELVFRALEIREVFTGNFSLESDETRVRCFLASRAGTYGVERPV